MPLVLYHGEQSWSSALDVAALTTPLDDVTRLRAAYRVLDISAWSDEQIPSLALGGMTQLALLALANSRRGVAFLGDQDPPFETPPLAAPQDERVRE